MLSARAQTFGEKKRKNKTIQLLQDFVPDFFRSKRQKRDEMILNPSYSMYFSKIDKTEKITQNTLGCQYLI